MSWSAMPLNARPIYYTNETETTLLKSFLGFPGDTKGY